MTASADEKIAGIKTTKFTAPPEVFKVDFENNPGFCPDGNASKCLGDGLLDVSNCIRKLSFRLFCCDFFVELFLNGH